MNNSGFECDIARVFSEFCSLTQKEMYSATRRALRAGAKQLQAATRANAVAGMKKRDNPHYYRGKLKIYNDKIEDAVRLSKIEKDFGSELSQPVHVYGTRDENSGTYRFRFLEKGTKERFAKTYTVKKGGKTERKVLKKPRRLGAIRPRWFFKNAQTQVYPSLPSLYIAEIDKAIQKINSTKIQ